MAYPTLHASHPKLNEHGYTRPEHYHTIGPALHTSDMCQGPQVPTNKEKCKMACKRWLKNWSNHSTCRKLLFSPTGHVKFEKIIPSKTCLKLYLLVFLSNSATPPLLSGAFRWVSRQVSIWFSYKKSLYVAAMQSHLFIVIRYILA
jgi:hypothetical protein